MRYEYFAPWDWIVAVGSYEDEFYAEANLIRGRIFWSMLALTTLVMLAATALVVVASRVLTVPIEHMIGVIRRVRGGRLDERMDVRSRDELGELAETFNQMVGVIKRTKEMESTLAQQEKMASLGVLSSGVAHEINNPLGVILGYAGYLEGKLDPADPNLRYIQEIRRESKRCKGIVQDLLSYARTPQPALEETDLNALLEQITEFAANHMDLGHVTVARELAPGLPRVLRRPRPDPPGGDQPHPQRRRRDGEGRDRHGAHRAGGGAGLRRRRRQRRRAPASRPRTSSGSSSRSSRRRRAGPGWAWPSRSGSSSSTRAGSWSRARSGGAPRSRCGCRCARSAVAGT